MMNLEPMTRITIPEAAVVAGQPQAVVEGAIRRGDLRYVLTGAQRRIRTTPAWVGGWLSSARGR